MRLLPRASLLAFVALAQHPARGAEVAVAPRSATAAAPSSVPDPPSPPTTPSSKRSPLSAEVVYPRSPEEARALAGVALLLVTATTKDSADLPIAPPTLHLADGTTGRLVQLVGQTDDGGTDPSDPAAILFRYLLLAPRHHREVSPGDRKLWWRPAGPPSPPVSDCIVAVVRCWRFPAPPDGKTVIVTYPFTLLHKDDGPGANPTGSGTARP